MAHPQWLDEEEARAWHAFIASSSLLGRRLDQQLRDEVGLSHMQYTVLVRLNAVPQRELRMTELADALCNTKSGLTYQVTQLEKAGLVRRRSCPSDVRAVYAVLTDDGRSMLERAAPGHVALVRELLIDVLSPAQLSAIADGLGEVARRMAADQPVGCGGGPGRDDAAADGWEPGADEDAWPGAPPQPCQG